MANKPFRSLKKWLLVPILEQRDFKPLTRAAANEILRDDGPPVRSTEFALKVLLRKINAMPRHISPAFGLGSSGAFAATRTRLASQTIAPGATMSSPRRLSDLQSVASKYGRGFLKIHRGDSGTGGRLKKTRVSISPRLEPLEDRTMLATFTVTSTVDSPSLTPGTLRWAINQVDASTDPTNEIDFDILPPTGSIGPFFPQPIELFSALPTITKQVDIDGGTQPGFSKAPLIAITGGAAGALAGNLVNGLTLDVGSSGSAIENLAIGGFRGNGIAIFSSDNTVSGCYIGMDVGGGTADGNFAGVVVEASGNTIGGTSTAAGNVISGNSEIGILTEGACLIEGNLIGTNATGTSPVPNGQGIQVGVSGVTIGGTSAAAGNVISGNGDDGIVTEGACLIEGNLIGTNKTGTSPVPNSNGIEVGRGHLAGLLLRLPLRGHLAGLLLQLPLRGHLAGLLLQLPLVLAGLVLQHSNSLSAF